MLKYVDATHPDDSTRNYSESYETLTKHSYRGKDIKYITNEVENLQPHMTNTLAHVVVAMLGTNNVVGKEKCSDTDFGNYIEHFVEVVLAKFPGCQLFLLPILPRFDSSMSNVNSTIKQFNSIIKSNCHPKSIRSFQFIEAMFRPDTFDTRKYLCRDKLHLSFNGNKHIKNIIKANLHQWSGCWEREDCDYEKLPKSLRHLVDPGLYTGAQYSYEEMCYIDGGLPNPLPLSPSVLPQTSDFASGSASPLHSICDFPPLSISPSTPAPSLVRESNAASKSPSLATSAPSWASICIPTSAPIAISPSVSTIASSCTISSPSLSGPKTRLVSPSPAACAPPGSPSHPSLALLTSRLSYTPSFLPDSLQHSVFQYLGTVRRDFVSQGRYAPQIMLFGPHRYVYNKVSASLKPLPFETAPLVHTVLEFVNQHCQTNFNSVLVNLYPNDRTWLRDHKDDEKKLDKSQPIATLSLGSQRQMEFSHEREAPAIHHQVLLNNSLFVMHPDTQLNYYHRIPRGKSAVAHYYRHSVRFSLTFRTMKSVVSQPRFTRQRDPESNLHTSCVIQLSEHSPTPLSDPDPSRSIPRNQARAPQLLPGPQLPQGSGPSPLLPQGPQLPPDPQTSPASQLARPTCLTPSADPAMEYALQLALGTHLSPSPKLAPGPRMASRSCLSRDVATELAPDPQLPPSPDWTPGPQLIPESSTPPASASLFILSPGSGPSPGTAPALVPGPQIPAGSQLDPGSCPSPHAAPELAPRPKLAPRHQLDPRPRLPSGSQLVPGSCPPPAQVYQFAPGSYPPPAILQGQSIPPSQYDTISNCPVEIYRYSLNRVSQLNLYNPFRNHIMLSLLPGVYRLSAQLCSNTYSIPVVSEPHQNFAAEDPTQNNQKFTLYSSPTFIHPFLPQFSSNFTEFNITSLHSIKKSLVRSIVNSKSITRTHILICSGKHPHK